MIINSKLSNEALLKAIYKAASEYSKLIGNSYLIIGKNKNLSLCKVLLAYTEIRRI